MFVFNEGTLDLPSNWTDQTINVISSAPPMEQGMTFSITRDSIPWGMDFAEYVEDQIKQTSEALNDFELVDRRNLALSRAPAVEIECRWMSKQGPIHQIITTVQAAETRAMVITATIRGKISSGQAAEVRRITASLQLQPPRKG